MDGLQNKLVVIHVVHVLQQLILLQAIVLRQQLHQVQHYACKGNGILLKLVMYLLVLESVVVVVMMEETLSVVALETLFDSNCCYRHEACYHVGMEDTLTIDNYNESCHGNSGACKQVRVGGFDSIEIGESSCLS